MSWTVPDNKKIQCKSPLPTTIIEPISINNRKKIDNKKKAKKKKINIKEIQLITDGLSFSDNRFSINSNIFNYYIILFLMLPNLAII